MHYLSNSHNLVGYYPMGTIIIAFVEEETGLERLSKFFRVTK